MVWIITGITVCSILTATLSSALTNVTVSVERYDVTTGKTVSGQLTDDSLLSVETVLVERWMFRVVHLDFAE